MISPTFLDPASSKRDFPIYDKQLSRYGAYLYALQSLLEREGHSPTDHESIDFRDKIINQLNLIGNFGTTEDSQKRTFGIFEGFCKVFEFLLHKETGGPLRKINADHG